MPRHILSKIKEKGCSGNHVIVDCESIDAEAIGRERVQALRLWVASVFRWESGRVTRERWYRGRTKEEFWDMLYGTLQAKKATTVWTHNAIPDLTWLDLWGELVAKRQFYTLLVAGDGPTIIKTVHNKKNITYLDTLNFLKASLRDIGAECGLTKYEFPQSFDGGETWFDYCTRDVEILRQAVIDLLAMLTAHDWGSLGTTIAHQAWITYRKEYMDTPIYIHDDEIVRDCEERAYYGGRCDIFYCGDIEPWTTDARTRRKHKGTDRPCLYGETVYVLDVNSLYPSVMRDHPFPVKLKFSEHCPNIRNVDRLLSSFLAVGTCQIQTTEEVFPIRDQGRVIYPVGRYWTTLAGPEIQLARGNGTLVAVGELHCYEGADIFTRFVDELYAIRRNYTVEGKSVWAKACKYMVNALVGKFGQRKQRWEDTDGIDPDNKLFGHWFDCSLDSKLTPMRTIAGRCQKWVDIGYGRDAFPAISAYVTAYARCRMRRLMALLPPKTLLYSDTDSLHVLSRGFDAVCSAGEVHESELGKLKLVGKYTQARYYNTKAYVIGNTTVLAGLPVSADKTETGLHTWEEWDTFDRILDRSPDGTIHSRSRSISITGEVTARVVGADGWTEPRVEYTATEQDAIIRAKRSTQEQSD